MSKIEYCPEQLNIQTTARWYRKIKLWPATSTASSPGNQTTSSVIGPEKWGFSHWLSVSLISASASNSGPTRKTQINPLSKFISYHVVILLHPPNFLTSITSNWSLPLFFTVKFSHSPGCLWVSDKCKWWLLIPML